jgi:hypothetical protein
MQVVHILVVFHILFGALWFGGPLMIGSTLKKSLPAGQQAFAAATGVAGRMSLLGLVGTLGSLLTGVGLIFMKYGGMKGLPVRFHAALGLVLLASVLSFVLVKKPVGRLAAAAAASDFDAAAATSGAKRLSMGVGINHLLWLVCLVLMYAY